MARTQSIKGKCYICKKELGKLAMKNHLFKCNRLKEGDIGYFMIKVEFKYNKSFWLYLQVKEETTLIELDNFLRLIWLECCNHMSAFKIGGVSYYSKCDDSLSFLGNKQLGMDTAKLNKVVKTDMPFEYDYDFGSTTTLTLTVLEHYVGEDTNERISLLARNNLQEYVCIYCGKKASYIFTDYNYENVNPVCEQCYETGEENEDVEDVITITNSPRMGVCGYEGAYDVYEIY